MLYRRAEDDGVVTLTGEVDTSEARAAAGEIAEEQEGVIEVINDLMIAPEEETPSETPSVGIPRASSR